MLTSRQAKSSPVRAATTDN